MIESNKHAVRSIKILALAENRVATFRRDGKGAAIAQVQGRGMSALPKAPPCGKGAPGLGRIEGGDIDVKVAKKGFKLFGPAWALF